MRRLTVAAAPVFLALLTGCGGKHPVRGQVTLDDGTPLARGLIVFERMDGGPALTARGEIRPDGRYELSTDKPGDGVPCGKYKVLINPLDLSDVPDEQKQLPFDVKYTRFESSGLECEVKSGGTDYPVTLTRPAGKKREK